MPRMSVSTRIAHAMRVGIEVNVSYLIHSPLRHQKIQPERETNENNDIPTHSLYECIPTVFFYLRAKWR